MRRLLIALLAVTGCDERSAAPPPIVLDGSLPPRATEASCRLEGQPTGVLPELAVSEIEVEGVTLAIPVAMVPAPDGSGEVIVLEEDGRLLRLSEPDKATAGVVLLEGWLDGRALGLATSEQHPDHLFVASETPSGGVRLSRLDHSDGGIDPASLRVVLESASAHGLAITFDDEGLLYVALGDSATTPESSVDAANPATAEGSVMRIDVSSLDATGTFSVPADNPTGKQLGLSESTPVSTWATGLRSPRACAFGDGVTWCLDQGIAVGEVHHVGRARDLGWPTFDGISCLEQECDLELDRMPQAIVPSDEGCGLNGAQIYAGSRFPSLGGMLFYGDGCGEALHGMLLTSPDGHRQSGALLPIADVRGLGRDAAGEVYVLTPGRISRVEAKN